MKINKNNWRRNITLFIVLLSLFYLSYLFFYEPNYSGDIQYNQTLLIAHRGFGNYAPDNSISGVELAIDSGFDAVDLDSQLTADGELVIFHDPTLERLTDGTGELKNKTLSELKQLDIGYKFHENYIGEKMVTLGEMIEQVDGRILMVVELKSSSLLSEGIEEKAIQEIRDHNAYDGVYLSSFNPFVIYRLEKRDKRVKTVFIFRDTEPYDSTQLAKLPFFLKMEPLRKAIRKIIKPDILSVEINTHQSTINQLQKKGYPLFLWLTNTEKEIKESLERNPLGIITDEPILLEEEIK